MLNTRLVRLTVESRLAWAKKTVNRVYFQRMHFQGASLLVMKNKITLTIKGLKFPCQGRDVNR
ncbi:hypothetical protein QF010_000129 [Pseudomonas silensiensis]